MLFHFHKTTIIRSIPGNSHTEPETEPSQAQTFESKTSMPYLYRVDLRWGDVDCIVNNFYYYLIFILLLLWATLEQKPVKRVAYVKFQLIYTFAPVYLIFFDITNFNVYISKIHANWKKKPRGVSIVVKGLEAGVFFTGVGSNPMPIFLFSFIPLVTLKKIITFYPIVNLTTSNFDFIFHKLAKFTNFYSHSSSLKVISEIMGLIHWMCNLGAAHLHVYQPCLIFPLFLHYQSSFSLNVLWI